MARGEFIARMDADDISLPRRFERQIEFLRKHPEVGIAGTWATKIDKNNSFVGNWCLPTSPMVLRWNHFFRVCVIHPTVLMRRIILEKLDFYRPEALYAEDWDLWLRASAITEFSNTPEILFKYRVWSKSLSKRHGIEYQQAPTKFLASFINNFLGASPPYETITALKSGGSESLQQLFLAAALLESLYGKFVKVNALSKEDCRDISMDAARKMARLALQASQFSRLESLVLLKRALQIDCRILFPSVIFEGLKHRRLLRSPGVSTGLAEAMDLRPKQP
jgi:glycosyltransferase involved in cell wall biosynthesis